MARSSGRNTADRVERRESIIPNRDETVINVDATGNTTTPRPPWPFEGLSTKEIKNMNNEKMDEALKLTREIFDDYKDVVERFNDLVDRYELVLQQTVEAEQAADEAEAEMVANRNKHDADLLATQTKLLAMIPDQANNAPSPKRSIKLPDPPLLTDGKDPIYDDWKGKIHDKLTANKDQYDSEELRMAYLMSRVGGMASKHLLPRRRQDHSNKFMTADEMLKVLDGVFDDPNRRLTAQREYQKLYQGSRPFKDFWADFQRLAAELDYTQSGFMADLRIKVSTTIMEKIAGEEFTSLVEMSKKCLVIDQHLSDISAQKARYNRSKSVTATVGAFVPPNTSASRNSYTTDTANRPTRAPHADPKIEEAMAAGRCFYCNEKGHMARNCKVKEESRVQEVATTEQGNDGPLTKSR